MIKTNNKKLFWPFVSNGYSNLSFLNSPEDLTKYDNYSFHGNGRSYSQCCLNTNKNLLSIRHLKKIISYNISSGELIAQSGILIKEIHNRTINDLWIVDVTPGTQYVTLGGAIANDVHGKNFHSSGTFSNCINYLKLLKSNGKECLCSKETNKKLFYATIGGLGLTGLITEVSINLKKIPSSNMKVKRLPFSCLSDFINKSNNLEKKYNFLVGWVDFVSHHKGRGFIMGSNFIDNKKIKLKNRFHINLKWMPPIAIFNKLTIPIFNYLYYKLNILGKKDFTQNFQKNLYPLDGVLNWNKLYGASGFYQYQFIIPFNKIKKFEKELYVLLNKFPLSSFLVVLKVFNNCRNPAMLSFPKNGLSIAIDFQNKKGVDKLMANLHKITVKYNGKSYLAKDAFITKNYFHKFYPEYQNFKKYIDRKISSNLKRELF